MEENGGKFGFEQHKKSDLLNGKLSELKDCKDRFNEAYNYLIEAIEDIEQYLEAITKESEFTVYVD